jgi:hypothetical protein
MPKRIDIEYRRFRVIASEIKGRPAAIAMQGGTRLFEASATTIADAVAAIKAKIDNHFATQAKQRRKPHIATTAEYIAALRALSIGKHEHAMLRAHALARNRTLTAGELAKAAGYESYASANSHYGKLGRRVAGFLDLDPPTGGRTYHKQIWTFALAEGDLKAAHQGLWRWKMHRELAAALRELNMA